ncbi:MAG TPA: F0F1 ATP synthase subunit delta [Candidatus Saccharimonadales bacterium]|nr:F0F1 ATP synthase subunit delta [Candidatus Saccharimonadales bacterium]
MEHLKLPTLLVSHVDVARLIRELENLDEFFTEAKIRNVGTSMQLPKLSRMMDQLASSNSVNLLDEQDRAKLLAALKKIYDQAPKMHISFAAEPSPKAFEKILVWLRENIDPHTLVQIGLQPAIAAGCVVRTPNKVFDMSLRSALTKQQPYLVQLIKGAVDGR